MYRVCAFVVALCLGGGSMIHAADQTILGKRLLVKDPKPGLDPTKRKIVAEGKEKASPDGIVGDPTLVGATATVFESGATHLRVLPALRILRGFARRQHAPAVGIPQPLPGTGDGDHGAGRHLRTAGRLRDVAVGRRTSGLRA
jgi:hypothetical protein